MSGNGARPDVSVGESYVTWSKCALRNLRRTGMRIPMRFGGSSAFNQVGGPDAKTRRAKRRLGGSWEMAKAEMSP